MDELVWCGYREPRLISRTKTEIRREGMDAVSFCSSRLGVVPDARQEAVLRSTAKRGILNCARQWGKSLITAAMAVYRAMSQPDQMILFASPSERQSAELLRKASKMAARLGVRPRGDGDNEQSLVFPNGSRIVAIPGTEDTVRGFSAVNLMLIDEASRVADSLYYALRPMLLVSDGDLWLMSTPNGRSGFFYEAFTHGGDEWERFAIPATENPRIRPDQLERERREMGPSMFRQEFLCEFVAVGTQCFGDETIEAALDDEFEGFAI